MSKRSQSAPVPDEQQQQRQLQQQQQRQLQQQSQTSSSLQMPPPSHPYSHSATPPRIVQTHNVPTSITSSIPISATGTVGPVRIKTVSSSLGGGMGTATTVQGRRLQYQLSVPTRLENGAQFIQSSHTPYSSQQSQHHGALGTNGSSNSGLRPVQASIGTGTSTTRSPQQQQLRPAQQNTFDSNRYDGNRASQATNANTNTQTTMATGTTTTGTTNQTGMTDKPKSRKKDKPPRIPPPELIEDNNNKVSYTRGMSLGEGGFASCYIISDQRNCRYAAKVIQKTELPTYKTRQKLFAEIKIHQGLEHENIVKYYHCFEDDDFVYLVLELCENKTLMELIKRRKRLTEPEVRYYMKEIVAACSYLHRTASVIHRDLKLGNIFLTHDLHVRIGDFGLATLIVEDERKRTICGTPNYIAPEILFDTDNGHSFEVDIWSVGVIMYTLLIGKPPFQTNEVKAIYKKIRDNNYVFPEDVPVSEEAKSLIAALLTPTPASRPSVESVLNHPFFTSGYCPEKLDQKTLQVAPNFEQEELRMKQQLQHQRNQDELSRSTFANRPSGECVPSQHSQQISAQNDKKRQQLHHDQTSFGDGLLVEQPTRRFSEMVADFMDQKPINSPLRKKQLYSLSSHKVSLDQMRPTSRLSGVNSKHYQDGSPIGSQFQYGEQVRMEMVDGDRVTTEIRTINFSRGQGAPNFSQFSQSHGRPNQTQQPQSSRPKTLASSSHYSQPLPRASKTQASIHVQSSVQEIRNTGSISSQSIVANTLSSRLPVPRSRVSGGPVHQHLGHSDHPSSPLAKFNHIGSSTVSSPRPSSASSVHADQKAVVRAQSQRQSGETQSSQRMTSSFTDRIQATSMSSSHGMMNTKKPPLNHSMEEVGAQKSPIVDEAKAAVNLFDLDTDMDVDHDVPQHLDLLIANISGVIASPIKQPGSNNFSQDQQQSLQRLSTPAWRSPQQSESTRATLIQNVQGVERPASAMQRTFSQEKELSDINQVSDSPRRIPGKVHSQANESTTSTLRGSSQLQQHSFLQSSQQEYQSSRSLKQSPIRGQSGLINDLQPSQPSQQHLDISLHGINGASVGMVAIETEDDTHIRNTKQKASPLPKNSSQTVDHHQSSGQSNDSDIDEPYLLQSNNTSQHCNVQAKPLPQEPQQFAQLQSPKTPSLRSFSFGTDHTSNLTSRSQSQSHLGPQMQDERGDSRSSAQDKPLKHKLAAFARSNGTESNAHAMSYDVEVHSKDQDLSKEIFEGAREMDVDTERETKKINQHRFSSQQNQMYEQGRQQGQLQDISQGGNNNNNHTVKQSNHETTMAGISSGGHSDEQDHVEVPSTSCITATSMSFSMRREPCNRPKLQSQYQDAASRAPPHLGKSLNQAIMHKQAAEVERSTARTRSNRMGICEEVEYNLRKMLQMRKSGILPHPGFDVSSAKPPAVFLTRWINYARYGVGWHLTNGVIGVFCNDKTTLAVSPNGIDLEIMEPPPRRKARSSRKTRFKDKDNIKEQSIDANGNSASSRHQRHGSGSSKGNNALGSQSSTAQSVAESMADMRMVLEREMELDLKGSYPIPDNMLVGTQMSHSRVYENSNSNPEDMLEGEISGPSTVDFDDDWDNVDFLAKLERTHCRISKYPSRLEKKMRVLQGFKNYMLQMLSGLSWSYEDTSLTRGMPFLTDFFRKRHVVSRLSNGIVQINFADHTKMIFSEHGKILTFIDNDDSQPRRLTLTVHQALTPEFFYNPDDESDHQTLIQADLDQMSIRPKFRKQQRKPMQEQEHVHSINDVERSFDPEKDYDLPIFPRTCLIKKEIRRQQSIRGDIPDNQATAASAASPLDERNTEYLSLNLADPNHALAMSIDACQVELIDISKEDPPVVIREMTFKQLHYQLVRRLRIAQELLHERRLQLAEERRKERIEKEQLAKDREDNRRRRQQRQSEREKERELASANIREIEQ